MAENVVKKTGEVLDSVEQALSPKKNEFTLSTGVVLRARKVPIMLIQSIERKFPMPKAPVTYIPEKEREEINWEDPGYKAELKERETAMSNAYLNVISAYGTEVVSLPESIPAVMDDSWVEDFKDFYPDEIPETDNKRRYLAWISLVAAPTQEDLQLIAQEVSAQFSVPAHLVAEEMDGFRGK